MQVNFNNNNLSFNGGFRFPNMPKAAKEALPLISHRGKQIFYDFEKEGDVFLVTRDAMDLKVADFIKTHKLNCEYYPEINTKCHFDSEQPQMLSEVLKTKTTEDVGKVSEVCMQRMISKMNKPKTAKEPFSYVDCILDNLEWVVENHKINKLKNGVFEVIDDNKKRKILISPANRKNEHYVYVTNTSGDFYVKRYAMKSNGKIVKQFNRIEDIKNFKNAFCSLLNK